jgi:uncharacterized membrane protein YkoI
MKPKSTALVSAAILALSVGAAYATDSTTKKEETALSNSAVSLTQAIHMAEQKANGQAISAEYSPKSGTAGRYEIKVLSNDGKQLTEYYLDPNTGTVTKAENEPFEKMFTRLKPKSIQNAPTSLTRAVTTAETRAGGKATEAEVDRDGDQVMYTVKVAKADGSTEKVKVNGSDGKVASAK